MRPYIITQLILQLFGLGARLLLLTVESYPRTVKRSRSDDAVAILVWLGFIAWGAYVLTGGR